MKASLAINGGQPTVPEGLKKRWPDVTQADRDAVMGVLDRNIFTSDEVGPEATAFEKEWAEFVGCRYALAVNSGTAAIHLALVAANVRPGDEVITTAYTFGGTFQPILHQGAIPVFVDIDPRTYNLDANQIESKITDRTRVLMPVHMHGLPADMSTIQEQAQKYNLTVVEDAAQAHGATYQGKMTGNIGDMGCFSLNATKNLAGGEGGLFTTNDEHTFRRVKMARTFGEKFDKQDEPFRPYVCHEIGWNYRLPELSAAFARSQLKRLSDYNAIGQRNGKYLDDAFARIKGLIPPHTPPECETIYHKYRLRFDLQALGINMPSIEFRDTLIRALHAEGVAATLWHFRPVPTYPMFQQLDVGYGDGYPWRSLDYNKEIEYNEQDYPETQHMLESTLIVNDEQHPICNQETQLMEYYVTAFQKVFDHLDELLS